jgi:N6-adenosine-specific RNA methylase IME4
MPVHDVRCGGEMNWPTDKYKIIYADPPWSYNDHLSKQSFGGFNFMGAGNVYDTQEKDWIKNLPVNEIADKDCSLFMWATNPLLPEALDIIPAWGFKFKTVAFVWVKRNKNLAPVYNLGRWTMGGVELCLLATKGKPQRIRRDIKQVDYSMRSVHSGKPPSVRNKIVELMGDIPRIELFARQKTDGWDAWGNEADKLSPNKSLSLVVNHE